MSNKDLWAESLVGRDWEIFWENGDTDTSGSNNEIAVESKEEVGDLTSVENSQVFEGKEEEEEEEEDISDWYDGRIINYNLSAAGTLSFDIKFVGEDQTYTMELPPSSVRPSARAWLIRTKALFSISKKYKWEEFLPVDTSTLDDQEYLQQLKNRFLQDSNPCGAPMNERNNSISWPGLNQFSQMKRLQYEAQAQIYLRGKLATVIAHDEEDENEPNEGYLNFLMKQLEKINASCEWYTKCWNLIMKVQVPGKEALLELDTISKEYVQAGRDTILSICDLDITPAAAKRKLDEPTSGTRRTKRRRFPRNLSEQQGVAYNEEETDHESEWKNSLFLNSKEFEMFEERIKGKTVLWPILLLLEMLKVVTCQIQEPAVCWTREVACVLGDEKKSMEGEDLPEEQSTDEDENGYSDDDEISVEEVVKMYSYDDISSVLNRASCHEVLQKFNLSLWSSRLVFKLQTIKDFEVEAHHCIIGLAKEVEDPSRESDPILKRLYALRDRICKHEYLLQNVTPLAVSSASNITKNLVEDACSIREWVIDLVQSEKNRERIVFLEEIVAKASDLPQIPSVQSHAGEPSLNVKIDRIISRANAVASKLCQCNQTITQYDQYLSKSVSPREDLENFRTIHGISKALNALGSLPVLSLVEEKLSLRKELLLWIDSVKSMFDDANSTLLFVRLQDEYKKLEQILNGSSPARLSLTKGLRKQEQIDKQICQFVREDVNNLSNKFVRRIETLYTKVNSWKERAGAIICSLRFHGNILAGEALSSTKVPAMVDCRRMEDLIDEYEDLNVSIETQYTLIQSVYKHAISWSERVTNVVENESNLLKYLTECSKQRPKGVIVEPARHVLELIIDLLKWHDRVKCAIGKLRSLDGRDNGVLVAKIYSLIIEGSEIIRWYSKQRNFGDFCIDSSNISHIISRITQDVKSSKVLSLSRIQATAIGKRVCERLGSLPFDSEVGAPLFSMVHIVWAINIKEYLSKANVNSDRLTLQEATVLLAREPKNNGISSKFFVYHPLVEDINKLTALTARFKNVEDEARKLLAPCQNFFRDSMEKTHEIRDHQAALKDLNTRIKTTKYEGVVLLLDPCLEKAIDQRVKDVSWLVRTLNYPPLHNDEIKVEQEKRIPWDVLVSLFERVPSGKDDVTDDMQRLILRVNELYDAANMWQAEVSSFLSLSIRGAKRRNTTNGTEDLEQDGGRRKVSYMQLSNLAKDPVLEIIAMPREKSVRHVLEQVNEFEKQMCNLLGKDFSAVYADKAPYPKTTSLVGRDGKFYLYRLTGSQLFLSLKSLVDNMAKTASDIAADTPEKKAFDWIRQCVDWLQGLDDAITEQSPFGGMRRLFLRTEDASHNLSRGNQLLLGVTDEIRKTLSNYKIIVSTNKQSGKLSVTIAKGGAHHSIGGTVIKWCPLVLDWIRHDIDKKTNWENEAKQLLLACKESSESRLFHKELSQAELNETYEKCENVKIHLRTGRDLLVIAPDKSLIERLEDGSQEIEQWLKRKIEESEGSLSLMSARLSRYEGSSTAIQEREEFLDSLLLRRRIYSTTSKKTASVTGSGDDIRSKARFKIEKLMKKGMRMMGFRIQGASDISLLCTMKAFEIENAAFSAFCSEGVKTVSKEYTEKLLRLQTSLDPSLNAAFCARVLTNDITSDKLVLMSPGELSVNNLVGQKARAECVKSNSEDATAKKQKSPEVKKKMAGLSLRTLTQSSSQTSRNIKSSALPKNSLTWGQMQIQDTNGLSYERCNQEANEVGSLKLKGSEATSEILQNTPAIPPPPPSLVALNVPSGSHSSNLSKGSLLSNDNGDKFHISVSDTRANFQVKVLFEEDIAHSINVVLPHTIKIKKRSRVDEYTSFLTSKLRSGNSILVLLRLSICGKVDDYKRFYKDYESKKRIAMCKLGEDTLFLVTPKFHVAAKEIRNKVLSKTSTYGVLIKRLHSVG
eukprot:CAMPEP_0178903134 /NCGR_PEP_ID=MMETSP0786-20121207/4990_1 /TAXON_ID=186022 /ORGANISM="Thalassionema frauenfeldii, Strain CCMP 1798" /LENGTH=1932 /DNA_ID=CAMNT_0020574475 /DNA_START=167 /DNA_END=5965 /DNA_ORIENTATION=+